MNFSNKIYLKLILKDVNKHNVANIPIAAFIYDFIKNEKFYINFEHPDLLSDISFKEFKEYIKYCDVYVINKKKYKYWLNGCNLIDINLFGFIKYNNIIDEAGSSDGKCLSHINNININGFAVILPYVVHQGIFDKEAEKIKEIDITEDNTYCFKFFNNIITDSLYIVEKNGLKINKSIFDKFYKSKTINDFVYTDYHIYNPTGRPSNSFDNINYAALKKDDGSRESFISRYINGYLLMVDFTGFHPYIVANLIDYKVPDNETIYEHLAKQFYNVQDVTSEMMIQSKKSTMINLYGQIDENFTDIEFFKKTEELKDVYWKKFQEKGYVYTPVYKRKITVNHIENPNKNKLFSYIIQAAETEYGIDSLSRCIKFVIDKDILPILYTYDSILFDVHPDTSQKDIDDLIDIIKNKKFKVKVYKGENYQNLKLI